LRAGAGVDATLRLSRIAEDLALFDGIVHHPPAGT
jgi:hypothetical protein